jgi:hypothetical protein
MVAFGWWVSSSLLGELGVLLFCPPFFAWVVVSAL